MYIEQVDEKISEQQKGLENSPAFFVGEQLKGICSASEEIAEIVLTDLENPDMSIANAEKQIKKYADENRKGASSFCVTPDIAEKIIKKFYGIDGIETTPEKLSVEDEKNINLEDFI